MTVKKVFIPAYGCMEIEGTGYVPKGRFLKADEEIDPAEYTDLTRMLVAGALSSNASLVEKEGIIQYSRHPDRGKLYSTCGKSVCQETGHRKQRICPNWRDTF